MRSFVAAMGTALAALTLTAGVAPVAQAATLQDDVAITCYKDTADLKRCIENNGRTWVLNKFDSESTIVGRLREPIRISMRNGNFTLTGCGTISGTYSLDANLMHIVFGDSRLRLASKCSDMEQVAMSSLHDAFNGQYVPVKPFLGRMELNTEVGLLVFGS